MKYKTFSINAGYIFLHLLYFLNYIDSMISVCVPEGNDNEEREEGVKNGIKKRETLGSI